MYLHDAQVANTITGLCTCFAGIVTMMYCWLAMPQPRRWFFVYFCILVTGIPTIWLHANEGYKLAGFFDVGTNILLAWAIQLAAAGDFYPPGKRRAIQITMTVINCCVWAWLLYEVVRPGPKHKLIDFGSFGEFYVGEFALICNGWVGVYLFGANWKKIPRQARPIFLMMFSLFFLGMILASAGNDHITWRFFAWHAAWHIVGSFGLVTLWLFNHVRFGILNAEQAAVRA